MTRPRYPLPGQTPATGPAFDPDQPIPFTLTPQAHALLSQLPEGQWACEQCGAAYFGAPPEDGLCPACRPGEDDQ